jgi:uncharacterized protein (DUF4415 family)
MADRKPNRTQHDATNAMIAAMQRFEWDLHHVATREGRVPREWREVWQNRTKRKTRVSLWLDEDVLKLFRSMGPGYGPRMNIVLRSFMYARMAAMLEGEDLLDSYREDWMGKKKPQVQEIVAEMERLGKIARNEKGTEDWEV